MKQLFTTLLAVLTFAAVQASHTLNYHAWYTVLEDNPTSTKFEFHLNVFAECYYSNPAAARSALMLGIYNPDTRAKIAEVQLDYLQEELLEDLSDAAKGACYARVELVNQFTLPKDGSIDRYLFQVSTCCYANFFQNILASQTPGIFQEWEIPTNLPKDFASAMLNSNTVYPLKTRTSAWLNFQESRESFDSIRYEFNPALHDPNSVNYSPGYCSPTALLPQYAQYRQDYTWSAPLGIHVNHALQDTGALKVGRNFAPGFHQIALKVNYYLNGKAYTGFRYITVHILPQLDPQLGLEANAYSDSSLAIRTNLSNFDDFKSAELQRSAEREGPFQFVRNLTESDSVFEDFPLAMGDTLYYRVFAVNAIDTFYSDTVFGVVNMLDFDLDLSTLGITQESIGLTWKTGSFPDYISFQLYREELGNPSTRKLVYSGKNGMHIDVGLASGTTYLYDILAVNHALFSNSDTLTAKTSGWKTSVGSPSETKLRFYPNPAQHELNFTELVSSPIAVYSSAGKLMYKGIPGKTLSLWGWASGVYIIRNRDQVYRFVKTD